MTDLFYFMEPNFPHYNSMDKGLMLQFSLKHFFLITLIHPTYPIFVCVNAFGVQFW